MSTLEQEHLSGKHEYLKSGCAICERDARILYQESMIEMMEADYLELVSHVDRILKGVRAFHHNADSSAPLIPTGTSNVWVPLVDGFLPMEGEEVMLMMKIPLGDEREETGRTRGYLLKDVWYSSASKRPLQHVVAWKKIWGQLKQKKAAPKTRMTL